jgi:hypothetical protein
MTVIPPEATTAAAEALHADRCVSESCRQSGHAADQMLASVHMTGDQSADLHIARVVLEAVAPLITAAHVSARLAEQDAVHADLAQLLRVLGLGDHARPQSPHDVMLDAINEAGRLRARLQFGERTEAQIRAAERERIRQLAIEENALYDVGYHDHGRPFADLIAGDSQ